MTTPQITNANGGVLFQTEYPKGPVIHLPIRALLEQAVRDEVQLVGACLSNADLTNADLYAGRLQYADMSGSTLAGAELSYCDLTGANLAGANLVGARLTSADVLGANLTGANLTGTNLSETNFTGSNLRDAHLSDIKADFFDVLHHASNEVAGLRKALVKGQVNGAVYYGKCACLIGTIAKIQKTSYWTIPSLSPDMHRPAERWFLGISTGDTPASNQVSSITVEWIDEYVLLNS